MNIRIISGKFGGRKIQAPEGKATHPMSERVRGSLFNIINHDVQDAEVLDIFAGTGSLGLEALSRGAASATFVERDRMASKILAENIKTLGVESDTTTVHIGAATWLAKNADKRFDVIFVDPPYDDMQFSVVTRLGELLTDDGLMILSYPEKTKLPTMEGLVMTGDRNYGTASLGFYRKG